MSTSLSELEAQRERLKRQLSDLGDLRPGSLVERYRKCANRIAMALSLMSRAMARRGRLLIT